MEEILKQYGIKENSVTPLGDGLINSTWLVSAAGHDFVLQKINELVFKDPEDIAFNCRSIKSYLNQAFPGYLFVAPLRTLRGEDMVQTPQGYFRLFRFIPGSHTVNVVETPGQAYEAAKQFGRFSKVLAAFDPNQLKITLPGFHDLGLRYHQFETALTKGNKERIDQSAQLIAQPQQHKTILDTFEQIKANPEFRLRIMHHDTKISNVLFDENDKGICVIDLDTVMPGFFISDVGDMMRTYLCPVSEEEKDITKIEIRPGFYKAIKEGYLSEMADVLTETEKQHFLFAGKFIIYMQALRFLTDHLNNDIYYGAKYEGHNYFRAQNQFTLLEKLIQFGTSR